MVTIIVSNRNMHKEFIDDGSDVNILSKKVMVHLDINLSKLILVKTLLIVIKENRNDMLVGIAINILITIGNYLGCQTL